MSRDERSTVRTLQGRVHELENQVVVAKLWARRLWAALSARTGHSLQAFLDATVDGFSGEHRRVLDVDIDAAEIVWERHRVTVVPCRVLIEAQERIQHFIVRYPSGESKNINRDQLLWMAGMDPSEAPEADPFSDAEVPF